MLDLSTPTPFSILINGTFLRSSLADYLVSAGLSNETTLTLQYVRSSIPPTFQASFEHDDWVTSIDVLSSTSPAASWAKTPYSGENRIVSASYDGLLRIWSPSGNVLATSAPASQGGHTAGIKAAKFLSPTSIASAGLDRTIRLWNYHDGSGPEAEGTIKPTMALYGHAMQIDSLAVHGASGKILSASADGCVGVWSTNKSAPAAPAELLPGAAPSAKRRKMNAAIEMPTRGALSMIQMSAPSATASASPATGVIFHPDDATVAYATSLDHTLRTLDLETGRIVDTRQTGHALLSVGTMAPGGGSGHVVAVGTAARHVTLLDPRAQAASAVVMTLRGHTNKVVSIDRDPTSEWGLVSGSHDGTVRVWDVRAVREGTREEGGRVGEAVFIINRESQGEEAKRTVGGEGVKVLSCRWDEKVGIVSAGEDKRVQINSGARIQRSA
jgi:ribosome biogenesis protein YTM1